MTGATDIVIVGAGLSGLYAAKLLRQRGLAVTVLEARDRVGGRMLSQQLANGSAVDLGAQWISPQQKRIQSLVREYGLETCCTHSQGNRVVEIDKELRRTSGEMPPFSSFALLDFLQTSWRVKRSAKKLSAKEPWEWSKAKQLDSLSFEAWLQKNTFSRETRTYWRYIAEAGMCASARDFSPLEVFHQIATIGGLKALETADALFLKKGAQTIAQRIADELGEGIHLSTPVQAIQMKPSEVCVKTDSGNFYAKRVLLALPPQLLEKISFDEVVKDFLQRRANHLVLGKVLKAVVVYEYAWWRDTGLSGAADTPSELVEFMADTSNQAGQPGVLVALSSGAHAIQLSQMDSEVCKATVLAHIQKVLGKAPLPPKDFFSMDWMRETYSQGGYASRRGIGGWTAKTNPLSHPFGLIHFAGSETATEWRSYMEGALQAAERASEELEKSLCKLPRHAATAYDLL